MASAWSHWSQRKRCRWLWFVIKMHIEGGVFKSRAHWSIIRSDYWWCTWSRSAPAALSVHGGFTSPEPCVFFLCPGHCQALQLVSGLCCLFVCRLVCWLCCVDFREQPVPWIRTSLGGCGPKAVTSAKQAWLGARGWDNQGSSVSIQTPEMVQMQLRLIVDHVFRAAATFTPTWLFNPKSC